MKKYKFQIDAVNSRFPPHKHISRNMIMSNLQSRIKANRIRSEKASYYQNTIFMIFLHTEQTWPEYSTYTHYICIQYVKISGRISIVSANRSILKRIMPYVDFSFIHVP